MFKSLKWLYKKIASLKSPAMISEHLLTLRLLIVLTAIKVMLIFSPQGFARLFKGSPTILYWPRFPHIRKCVLYKLRYVLGYRITTNPDDCFHRMIEWEDITLRVRDKKYLNVIERFDCVNAKCLNISKDHVEKIFEEVFEYPLSIDPLIFRGPAVQKSKINFRHDGRVILCPIAKREDGVVYQKVINNEFDKKNVYDIRVPIFENRIPFVYYKYRLKNDRFDNYFWADVVKHIGKVFTPDEIKKMLIFCQKIGLQYGELDVLRDKDDKKIYIVDVNNTPSGPSIHKISLGDFIFAIIQMAKTFDEVFIKSRMKLSFISPEDKVYVKAYKGVSSIISYPGSVGKRSIHV